MPDNNSYLLCWNSKVFPWDDLADEIEKFKRRGKLEYNWSCGNRRHLPEGSRVFLIRLGDQPKGIVASGWCLRKSYRKGGRNYIDLTWEVLSANPVVNLSELKRSPFLSFR